MRGASKADILLIEGGAKAHNGDRQRHHALMHLISKLIPNRTNNPAAARVIKTLLRYSLSMRDDAT